MRIHGVSLAVTAAVLALAAGCGGSSGGDNSGTDVSSTKAAFIKEVDAVCREASQRSEAEFTAYAKENNIALVKEPKFTKAQNETIVETILLPALREQLTFIRNAKPPAGDEEKVEKILTAVGVAVEKAEKDPAAAESPEKLLADADKLLSAYGFKVCGAR